MKQPKYLRTAVVLLSFAAAGASAMQEAAPRLVPVSRAKLCITKGAIEEAKAPRLEVTVPEMRAVVAYPTEQIAEAKFTYLGHTSKDKPLASGELRRQFGLKLRAQNGCNLVYVMWRIAPQSELSVLYKSNPGMSTSAECGTRGYHAIKPTRGLTVPRLKEGEDHTLRAAITGNKLQAWIDGKLVWEGILAPEALAVDGPVGVRSDNGRFKFEFLTSPSTGHGENPPCHPADGDE